MIMSMLEGWDAGAVWALTRRFVGEAMSSFIANYPIMYHDHFSGYEPFVGALIAGCAVYSSIFVCFPLSGAQINPMVTIAVVITRRMSIIYVPMYWIAQVFGALCALQLGRSLSPFVANRTELGMAMPRPGVSDNQALVMEIFITFTMLLAIVALLDELRIPNFHPSNRFNAFVLLVSVFLMIEIIGIFMVGPVTGMLLAVILYEFIICPDASLGRAKALLSPEPFDRSRAYSVFESNKVGVAPA
ncbi:unnamed protein product [Schistocephalus solidus]|uniref:Aquaporin n=1 Tax=Schistocephalus solidus TaxID=70667 RepID=A0A183SKA0_SCHSO|nr:unnamed protein product [Schistocephalus solidus]